MEAVRADDMRTFLDLPCGNPMAASTASVENFMVVQCRVLSYRNDDRFFYDDDLSPVIMNFVYSHYSRTKLISKICWPIK